MNVTQQTRIANRRAAWRWGGLVVGLLTLQVIGGIMAIVLATGDQSVAVVPDYHQKALHWDDEVAVRAASQALGWNCVFTVIDRHESRSGLSITLTGADGMPIEIRTGELEIYRHARAADVRTLKIPAGKFLTLDLPACFDTKGLWQVSIDITDAKGNRFVESKELNVDSGVRKDGSHTDTENAGVKSKHSVLLRVCPGSVRSLFQSGSPDLNRELARC